MNLGTFAGRLGRDASLKETQNGTAVLNFVLAVDVGWGNRKETLWVDCAVWGERAEKLEPYLVKGKAVTVSGDVNLRTFEKKDGTPGAAITLNVQRLDLQGSRQVDEGIERAKQLSQRGAAEAEAKGSPVRGDSDRGGYDWKASEQRERAKPGTRREPAAAGAEDFDDDIPF